MVEPSALSQEAPIRKATAAVYMQHATQFLGCANTVILQQYFCFSSDFFDQSPAPCFCLQVVFITFIQQEGRDY